MGWAVLIPVQSEETAQLAIAMSVPQVGLVIQISDEEVDKLMKGGGAYMMVGKKRVELDAAQND